MALDESALIVALLWIKLTNRMRHESGKDPAKPRSTYDFVESFVSIKESAAILSQ